MRATTGMVIRIVAITTACSLINLISDKIHLYLNIKKAVWEKIFFHYPHALHALNRVMATGCAEIAPVLIHLLWLAAPQHSRPSTTAFRRG